MPPNCSADLVGRVDISSSTKPHRRRRCLARPLLAFSHPSPLWVVLHHHRCHHRSLVDRPQPTICPMPYACSAAVLEESRGPTNATTDQKETEVIPTTTSAMRPYPHASAPSARSAFFAHNEPTWSTITYRYSDHGKKLFAAAADGEAGGGDDAPPPPLSGRSPSSSPRSPRSMRGHRETAPPILGRRMSGTGSSRSSQGSAERPVQEAPREVPVAQGGGGGPLRRTSSAEGSVRQRTISSRSSGAGGKQVSGAATSLFVCPGQPPLLPALPVLLLPFARLPTGLPAMTRYRMARRLMDGRSPSN